MSRKHVFRGLLIPLFMAVFLCSCGENTSDSTETRNLFQYALEIEDGVFAPRQVDFFMSVEEVLQAAGLKDEDEAEAVYEGDGVKKILADVDIDGFPYDLKAMYVFYDSVDNLLTTVQYVFRVDEAEAADIYNLLYEQAAATMPEAFGNTIEGIKDGVDVSWEDKEKNYVRLLIDDYSSRDDNLVTIDLIIQVNAGNRSLP